MVRKRLKIGLAALLLGLAGLGGWQALRTDTGPVYQGKSLRSWLYQYNPPRYSHSQISPTPEQRDAENAIRSIGTNGIPTLLNMLAKKDSAAKSLLVRWWDRHLFRLPRAIRFPAWYRNQASTVNDEAVLGFEVLGATASNSVPALISLYERNISPKSQQATSRAIRAIGPAAESMALPSFLRATASSNATERRIAITALSRLDGKRVAPQLVLPTLIGSLSDTDSAVRSDAATTLTRFGTNAQPAVPDLIRLLNDPDLSVRGDATNALRMINPDAATKVGIAKN